MNKYTLEPRFLEFDLKGSRLFDENLLSILQRLPDQAISLNVDDVGSGNLEWRSLKNISITTLMDNSESKGSPLVLGIITLANGMGLRTLIKGIENAEQLKKLEQKPSELVQGFCFGKPLNAIETEVMFKTFN